MCVTPSCSKHRVTSGVEQRILSNRTFLHILFDFNNIMTLPLEYRRAFLSGVMTANGTTSDGLYRLHSSNKKMLYALRFIAESVGYHTNVAFTARDHQYIISGRVVNQSSRYTLSIFDDSARIRGIRDSKDNTVTWYRCSGFKMTEDVKTVYNLAVEGDNSFFADSIAVITNIF